MPPPLAQRRAQSTGPDPRPEGRRGPLDRAFDLPPTSGIYSPTAWAMPNGRYHSDSGWLDSQLSSLQIGSGASPPRPLPYGPMPVESWPISRGHSALDRPWPPRHASGPVLVGMVMVAWRHSRRVATRLTSVAMTTAR